MEPDFKHVVPLLIFTALAIVATGLATAVHYYSHPDAFALVIVVVAAACAASGGAISFLHLGRKGRAPRAVLGVSHSWLSREVIMLSLFVVFLVGTIAAFQNEAAKEYLPTLFAMCAAAGLVLCLTIGMVYNLGAQLAWKGLANMIQPAIGALVLAAVLYPEGGTISLPFAAFIAVDLVFSLVRHRRHALLSQLKEAVVFPDQYIWTGKLWMLRQGLWSFITAGVIFGYPLFSAGCAIATIFVDRLLFYAGAVQAKPSSRIAIERRERMEQAAQ